VEEPIDRGARRDEQADREGGPVDRGLGIAGEIQRNQRGNDDRAEDGDQSERVVAAAR
jgi:hypothetical protein